MRKYPGERTGNDNLCERFDSFAKRTIRNIIKTELRSYLRESKKNRHVDLEQLRDSLSYEWESDLDKTPVSLGPIMIFLENDQLAKELEKLKIRHRMVLGYAYVLELPLEVISDLMDLAEKSVRNYKSEALRILREKLKDLEDED